jgi:hypothetical protein
VHIGRRELHGIGARDDAFEQVGVFGDAQLVRATAGTVRGRRTPGPTCSRRRRRCWGNDGRDARASGPVRDLTTSPSSRSNAATSSADDCGFTWSSAMRRYMSRRARERRRSQESSLSRHDDGIDTTPELRDFGGVGHLSLHRPHRVGVRQRELAAPAVVGASSSSIGG